MSGQVADKDYFLDADGNVAQDEESAATLLVRQGQEMSKEVAEKVNQVARQTDTSLVEESEGSEKAAAPSANKSAKPTKNKGAK